ncbi:MAG: hypothetical protein ACYC1E_07030 [Propionibacteriaceae bacterium]
MTDPTHGPSTPDDQDGPASYGPLDPAAHDRGGLPRPPRPVFQRPPGYDTLSPASPYTVVFEPWPDTTVAQSSGQRAGTAALPADLTATLTPAPSAEARTDVASERLPPEPAEVQPSGTGSEPDEPAESPTDQPDDVDPPLLPRPYATSFVLARPVVPEPAPPYVAAAQPYSPATQAYAQSADMPATQSYRPATQSYRPATHAKPQPFAPAPQPPEPQPYPAATRQYGLPAQPPLAASFAPSVTQPYGGPASVQPYPGSSNTDPYFSFVRPPTAPPQFGSARPRTENVGRGLAMALLAVVGGCVLSAFVYHLGFVASIVALAMGAAGIFLYAKGAGAPPRKGALALVVLLIAGILLAWVSSVGTELYFYYVDRTGTAAGAVMFVLESVLSVDLFKAMLKDFLIFVGFGVLGIFGVARQLFTRRAR